MISFLDNFEVEEITSSKLYTTEELDAAEAELRKTLPEGTEYFLGGSAGMGTKACDIDFFVRVDPVDLSLDSAVDLFSASGYTPHKASQYQDSDFATLRKGDINIILIANPDSYVGRQRGFESCKYITQVMCVPLTKEHRKAIHKLAAGEDLA
jgi:hypothetical protein